MVDSEPAQKRKPGRRLTISVRTLMLAVLVVGGGLGWWLSRVTAQKRAVALITRLGGDCFYDIDVDDNGELRADCFEREPWLRNHGLLDLFHNVVSVGIVEFPGTTPGSAELPLSPAEMETLWADLEQLRRLKSLFIPVDKSSLPRLARLERLPELERLSIWGAGNATFDVVSRLKHLRALNISVDSEHDAPTPNTDAGVALLADLPRLQELTLSSPNITDAALISIGRLKELRYLELDDKQLAVSELVHLSGLTELRTLVVSTGYDSDVKGSLDDATLAALAKLVRLERLQLPEVLMRDFTDHHLELLTSLRQLEELDLRGSRITNAAVRFLKRLPKLRRLDVSSTDIDGSGLEELAGHPSLRSLSVSGTRANKTEIDALRKSHRRVFIEQ